MDRFYRITNSLVDYIVPKRRRAGGPATPSKLPDHVYLQEPATDPQGTRTQAALHQRIGQKYDSISDTRFRLGSRKRAREEDSFVEGDHRSDMQQNGTEVDDGSTIMVDTDCKRSDTGLGEELSPHESASQVTPPEDSEDGLEEDEEEQPTVEENEEQTADEKVIEFLARQVEHEEKKAEIAKVKAAGDWHPDEIFLFERLALRSFEPLLPRAWSGALPILPEDIWSDLDGSYNGKAFIDGKTSNGAIPLNRLLEIGSRVADGSMADPASRIRVPLKQFLAWSERDGQYATKRFIPVLAYIVAKKGQTSAHTMHQLSSQIQFLARSHRDNLRLDKPLKTEDGEIKLYRRQPPLLYGLVIANTSVVIATLDSANSGGSLRHIANFDFAIREQAAWNGLAVAIVIICARNAILPYVEEFEEDDLSSDADL